MSLHQDMDIQPAGSLSSQISQAENLKRSQNESGDSSYRPPQMKNEVYSFQSKFQQSQREQQGQTDEDLHINTSKIIQQTKMQDFDRCKKYQEQQKICQALQKKLLSMEEEMKAAKEVAQKIQYQYQDKFNKIQSGKQQFKENLKANVMLLISFLQKKYKESSCQQLMKEYERQINDRLFGSNNRASFNQYLQDKIRTFQSQEDTLNRINTQINALNDESRQILQLSSQYEKLKLNYETQKMKTINLEKDLGCKLIQTEGLHTKLKLKEEQIGKLKLDILQLSQQLLTEAHKFNQLQVRLSKDISDLKNLHRSKSKIELQGQLSKNQDERWSLERQLEQIKATLDQERKDNEKQIEKLRNINMNLQKELADQKKYYAQRLSKYQDNCRNVEEKAIIALNDVIYRFDRSMTNNKDKSSQELSSILSITRLEAANSNKILDQIMTLQEKINDLIFKQAKHQVQLAAREQQISHCQAQINRLKVQKQKLMTDFANLKLGYEQEFTTIKNIFYQKLAQGIKQSSQFYSKLMKEQEEMAGVKLQAVKSELELTKQKKKLELQLFEDQKLRHIEQVNLLKKHISNLENKCTKDEERKEIELKARCNQIILETEKLRYVEATSQNQQRLIQQFKSEILLFNKTLAYIHKQLDKKSLKEVIATIDEEKQAQYHRPLLDLMNCIYYLQNQTENELSSLHLQISGLKKQIQHISFNLSQQRNKLIQKNKKLMACQKNLATFSQKIGSLEEQTKSLKEKNVILRKQNEQINKQLQYKTQQLQLSASSGSQASKDIRNLQTENSQLKYKVEELQREIAQNKKVYDEMTININNYYKNQKALKEEYAVIKGQVVTLQSKLKNLSDQNQILKQQSKNQDINSPEIISLKATIIRLEQQSKKQKQRSEILLQNKSSYERQLSSMKEKCIRVDELNRQLTNKLKIREDQAKFSRPSLTSRQAEKVTSNDEKIKQLQSKNQILQADIKSMRKNKDILEEKINQLRRQIEEKRSDKASNEVNKVLSWSQSQECMNNYLNMIQSLRQQKSLLEQEIVSLNARIKRIEGNNKVPKSYISPGRSTIMVQKSPPKVEKVPQQKIEKVQIPQQNMHKIKRYAVFGVSCLLDEQQASREFLLKKIQELFTNKKITETRLVYKLTQASKTFSFATLIPKAQIQTQSFLFLFSTKTDIFGVLSYKKDAISKQTAMILSTNTQKVVSKRPTGDSVTATAVIVDFNGQLNIGNGHLKMKSSSRSLMVKEVLGKYFEPYEKKDIFGKDYWRDEMTIDLTEFQIHKIYLK